jgi:hypothetical protein
MKINKIFNILLVSVLALSLVSCIEKSPVYQPAEKVSGEGVFFQKDLPSSITLTDKGFFDVSLSRTYTDNALTTSLNVTADDLFTIPSSVDFEAGASTTGFTVKYDPTKIEYDKKYEISISFDTDTTAYGNNLYKVTCVLPNPIVWERVTTKARFVENIFDIAFGMPESSFNVYVEKMEGKEIYRIANLFSTYKYKNTVYQHPEYGSDKSIYPEEIVDPLNTCWTIIDAEGDYLKAIDPSYSLKPGEVFIPIQTTNVAYNLKSGGAVITPEKYALGVYDKAKKSFTFGEYGFNLPSKGWYLSNGALTALYLDETLMIEDYNTYSYKLAYKGDVESPAFDDTFTDQPLSVSRKDETIYYLNDYFAKGYGLAFVSDSISKLKNNAEILNVKNEQNTGLVVFGQQIYANVKGGVVTIAEAEGSLPVFEININIYAKDSEGNVVTDYGRFKEIYKATSMPELYTADDIAGANKSDYIGTFNISGADFFDEDNRVDFSITIADGGKDADNTEWLIVNNISAINGYKSWNDAILVEWYQGFLYFSAQNMNEFLGHPVIFTPMNTEEKKYYTKSFLLGGFVSANGKLALVDYPYNDAHVNGYYITTTDGTGGISAFSNVFGVKNDAAAAPVASQAVPKYLNKDITDGNMAFSSLLSGNKTSSNQKVINRTLRLSNGLKNSDNYSKDIISKRPSQFN